MFSNFTCGVFLKLFSADGTTYAATCNQFYKSKFNFQKENDKKCKKYCSNAIEMFSTLVVSMVISPLLKRVAELKIGAVSSKFCLLLLSGIIFLVSLTLFE